MQLDLLRFHILAVAVVSGRTRTLVEKFERREKSSSNDDQSTSISRSMIPEDHTSSISNPVMPVDQATTTCSPVVHEMDKTFTLQVPSIPRHYFSELQLESRKFESSTSN